MNWFQWTAAALLAAVPAAAAASGSKPAAEPAVMVAYDAPFHRVVLTEDLRLTETKAEAEYDNPVSAAPSRTVKRERSTSVSPEQAAELLRRIRDSGFHELKDAYGAGPQERSYPTVIMIREGGQEKQVVYRSSPAEEERPVAFAKAEQNIIEFARQAVQTQIKKGE
ncbi:MAG: hypothetical protein ACTFAL_04240 [Candidatus Electronema sp. V4]|uniref:hypothetical protein n=1 Tax=Candidatus Electronema sp. V4 TaxID=3454756 RepID=UPI00405590F6